MSNFKRLKSRLGPQLDTTQSAVRKTRKSSDTASITSETSTHDISLRNDSLLSLPGTSSPLTSSQLSLNSDITGGAESSFNNGHISSISELPGNDQSDLESVTSEDPSAGAAAAFGSQSNLSSLSNEELRTAYLKSTLRLQKYKSRLKSSFAQNEDLNREYGKLKQLLETSQDKYMKKISELKETAALDKDAKVHMEQTFQAELEEKTMIIESLHTKVALMKGGMKSGSEEELERSKFDSLTEELSQQKDTIITYENSISGYKQMIQELSADVDSKKCVINDLSAQIEARNVDLHKLSAQLECKNNVLDAFQTSLSEHLPDLSPNFEDSASISISINAAFQRVKEEQQNEVEETLQKLKDTVSQLTNEKRKFEIDFKALSCENANFLSEVAKLRAELSESKSESEKAVAARNQFEEELAGIKEQNNELVTKLAELKDEFNSKTEEANQAVETLRNMESTADQSKTENLEELKVLTEEKSRLESEVLSKVEEISRLREAMAEKDTSINQLSCECDKLNERINNNLALIESLKKEIEDLSSENARISQECEQIVNNQSNSNESLDSEVTKTASSGDNQSRVEELELTICNLKQENAQLNKALLNYRNSGQTEKICGDVASNGNFRGSPDEVDIEDVIEQGTASKSFAVPSSDSVLVLSNSQEINSEAAPQHMTSTPIKRQESDVCTSLTCSNDKMLLQADITASQAKIENLLSEIESLSRISFEKSQSDNQIANLNSEIESLTNNMISVVKEKDLRIGKMTEELNQISQDLVCKNNEVETLSQLMKNQCSNEEYESCALENVEVKRKYFQLTQDIATLKESFAVEKDQAVNALELELKKNFNKDIRALTNEKTSLSDKLDSLTTENTELSSKVKSLEGSISILKSQLEELTNSLQISESKLTALESSLREKEADVATMVSRSVHDDLCASNDALKVKLRALEQEHKLSVEHFTVERENFNTKIAELEQSFVDANMNAGKLNALLDQYQSSSEEKFSRLSEEFAVSEANVEDLRTKNEKCEAQLAESKQTYETKLSELEKSLQEMEKRLAERQKELDLRNEELAELKKMNQQLVEVSEKAEENHKTTFVDYKKKVEEKFAAERQKIQVKFKTKDERISTLTTELEALKEDLSTKEKSFSTESEEVSGKIKSQSEEIASLTKSVNQLKEERELLVEQNSETLRLVQERSSAELEESQKILNATLEQSQADVENLQQKHKSEIEKLNLEISELREKLSSELQEKDAETQSFIQDLQSELTEKRSLVGEYKLGIEELKCNEKTLRDEHETEKRKIESEYAAERKKSNDEMNALRKQLSDSEEKLKKLEEEFNHFKVQSESTLKTTREQIDSLKSTSNRDRLVKDREIKTQSEEIYKLKDSLQKNRARYSDETSDLKSKHSIAIKALEDELKDTKSSLQQKIENLKSSHEEWRSNSEKQHSEQMMQLSIEHREAMKNLLLEQEEKASTNENEITARMNTTIEDLRRTLTEKENDLSSLKMEMTDLIFKHETEISELNSNDFKQKYDELVLSSKQESKRLVTQYEAKIKSQETKTNEELRRYEKQMQEQKLVIANLEFEMEDLESNYKAERARNDILSKESKTYLKQSELTALLDAKDAEIQELERKAALALANKESEHEDRLRMERNKIVNEMDEFYAEKQAVDSSVGGSAQDLTCSTDNFDDSFQTGFNELNRGANGCNQPAVLSPTYSHGSTNSLFEDPTQMQFLRHILKQFITGNEKMTMAKVLVTLAKFDDKETKDILRAVKHQNSRWL